MTAVLYPSWTVAVTQRGGRITEQIIDQVAIDQVLAGHRDADELSPVERREAFRQAVERGPDAAWGRAGSETAIARLRLSGQNAQLALRERPVDVDYRNAPIPYLLVDRHHRRPARCVSCEHANVDRVVYDTDGTPFYICGSCDLGAMHQAAVV